MSSKRNPKNPAKLKEPRIGDRIGNRFVIDRYVGRGAVATAWYVTEEVNNRRWLMTLVPLDGDDSILPLYVERRRQVYDVFGGHNIFNIDLPVEQGESAGYFYEVREWLVPVTDLSDAIATSSPMDLIEALDNLYQVANGLAVLHSASIIHAGLKPTNILISSDVFSAKRRVCISDVGYAGRGEDKGHIGTESQILHMGGTFEYAHPDLLRGMLVKAKRTNTSALIIEVRHLGPYVDIYAMGLIALEMLSGSCEVPSPLSTTVL